MDSENDNLRKFVKAVKDVMCMLFIEFYYLRGIEDEDNNIHSSCDSIHIHTDI